VQGGLQYLSKTAGQKTAKGASPVYGGIETRAGEPRDHSPPGVLKQTRLASKYILQTQPSAIALLAASPIFKGGLMRVPEPPKTITRIVLCTDCGWKKTVRSTAESGGAKPCRRAITEHRRKSKHKNFLIFDSKKEPVEKKKKKANEPGENGCSQSSVSADQPDLGE